MKYITITAPERMEESIIYLVRPRTTAADILKALKLTDFVLFPLSDPARLFAQFDQKDELYEQISNGDCLIALVPSGESEFYCLSLLVTAQEFAKILTRRVRARRGVLADS
jgi:hypothetical protein